MKLLLQQLNTGLLIQRSVAGPNEEITGSFALCASALAGTARPFCAGRSLDGWMAGRFRWWAAYLHVSSATRAGGERTCERGHMQL